MAAPELVAADPSCAFDQCLCRWHTYCSPRVPSVGPGRDYECMPSGADDSPAWSLLVGFIISSIPVGSSLLRAHRFRVARSGRVLGRNGDAFEIMDDVDYEARDASSIISGVIASPTPDGRSLCLFSREVRLADLDHIVPPRPLQMHLNLNADHGKITVSPLPGLPPEVSPVMPIRPISAAGDLWAPYLTEIYGPSSLMMQRLDKDAGRWVVVAAIDMPHGREMPVMWSGRVLQGYAVVDSTILLSLQPTPLFFTFDCSTCAWAPVSTIEAKNNDYKPIRERGVYVEEDDTIYCIVDSFVFAYKLCQDHDRHQYWMPPPTMVDGVCPFTFTDGGYGFLTHLGDRVMCSVWISVNLRCNCDSKHVLITTFRVKGNNGRNHEPFVPRGIEILHSTCRRLDMSPSKPSESHCEFSFLQEYEDTRLLEGMKVATSSNVVESTKMHACCRKFLNELWYSCAIVLEGSAIQTNKTLYIICQAASHSTVYKINILGGRLSIHEKALTPLCVMGTFICDDEYDLMNRPLSWHFVCGSEYIHAIPYVQNEIYEFSLHLETLDLVPAKRPVDVKLSIALVLQVGGRTIAISDTLQAIYHLSCAHEWTYHITYGSFDINRKVNLSGYVVLSNDSFMVYDDDTSCCFLLDLQMDRWSVVMPFSELTRSLEYQTELLTSSCSGSGFLSGRSVFVDGFIYTCVDGGLVAYEIIEEGDSYYLSDEIDLQLPWCKYWGSDRMCLDYVGKDTISGAIMFCMVQGTNHNPHHGAPHRQHTIYITTIQIKTERMHNGKLKPVTINHVDIATSFVEWNERNIWTSSCFAVDLDF